MRREASWLEKNSVRALLAAGVIWGVTWLLPESIASAFRHVIAPIAAPFQGIVAWSAFEIRDGTNFFSSISDLKRENEQFQRERLLLLQDGIRLKELEEENRLLREALRLPVESDAKTLPAEVISRDMNGVSMSLTLNRGSTDEVRVGMPVVIAGGSLIGRVSSVQLTSSEVRLLSHAESTVAARVAGSSIQGVVRGDHGLGLIFDMALSSEALSPGAALVTSGLGDALPKGLVIGYINEVRPSADRLFQQATIKIPMPFSDIRYASILISDPL